MVSLTYLMIDSGGIDNWNIFFGGRMWPSETWGKGYYVSLIDTWALTF